MITLKTLPHATAQEVFDQVAQHLLTQNQKSLADESPALCRYRNGSGLSCAAGCLIADDEYQPATMEKSEWFTLAYKGIVPSHHEGLISELQAVHDSILVEDWLQELKIVAQRYNLNTKLLEKFK